MKLPDFDHFEPLTSLREKMSASGMSQFSALEIARLQGVDVEQVEANWPNRQMKAYVAPPPPPLAQVEDTAEETPPVVAEEPVEITPELPAVSEPDPIPMAEEVTADVPEPAPDLIDKTPVRKIARAPVNHKLRIRNPFHFRLPRFKRTAKARPHPKLAHKATPKPKFVTKKTTHKGMEFHITPRLLVNGATIIAVNIALLYSIIMAIALIEPGAKNDPKPIARKAEPPKPQVQPQKQPNPNQRQNATHQPVTQTPPPVIEAKPLPPAPMQPAEHQVPQPSQPTASTTTQALDQDITPTDMPGNFDGGAGEGGGMGMASGAGYGTGTGQGMGQGSGSGTGSGSGQGTGSGSGASSGTGNGSGSGSGMGTGAGAATGMAGSGQGAGHGSGQLSRSEMQRILSGFYVSQQPFSGQRRNAGMEWYERLDPSPEEEQAAPPAQ